MLVSGICECRDYFSGHPKAVENVVPGGLAYYQPEKRSQCGESAASSGVG